MRPLLCWLLALALPLPAGAQHEHHPPGPVSMNGLTPATSLRTDLGRHHYRITTGSDRAQAFFDQGLRWLWAFNHDGAAAAFLAAEREDPTCAMCAWGIAYAVGPNINAGMTDSALEVARAAIERATSRVGYARPVERALIDALSVRYGEGDRAALDSAYAAAMRQVVQGHPEDPEARVLLADALMNLAPWNYWNTDRSPRPDTPRIIEVLQDVLASNADHPGACHLFIHAVEAHFPARALPCAEQIARAMPGAGHLVHMPAHVYIRVGRYADAIAANVHALHADAGLLEGDPSRRRTLYGAGYHAHNAHFLAFAATMMGSSRLALQYAARAARTVDVDVARANAWVYAITPVHHLTLVTFGRWNDVLRLPMPPAASRYSTGMAYYARGVAFAARHRWAEAHASFDSVRAIAAAAPADENGRALAIAVEALAGELERRHGRLQASIARFSTAVAMEDQLAYAEPPTWFYPLRHSLGQVLLRAGRPADAERVYREDLERFPENGWALHGLAESLLRQGRRGEAREVTVRFTRAWANADVQLRGSRF